MIFLQMILDSFLSDFKYNLVTNTKNQRLMKQDEIFWVETRPTESVSPEDGTASRWVRFWCLQRGPEYAGGTGPEEPKELHTSCFLRWNFYGSDIRSIKQADLLTGVSETAAWRTKKFECG